MENSAIVGLGSLTVAISLITFDTNAAEEIFLYHCDARQMSERMKQKHLDRSHYRVERVLQNFPIHFLWGTL